MVCHYLDITQEHCPMTFVKVKLKMEEIAEGDHLEILLADGEPINSVPRSIEEGCGKILSKEQKGAVYLLRVQKK